jgi:hypothetical protein
VESDYSLHALHEFLQYVGKKGLITKQQAQNWRVASGQILSDLTPAEEADVRLVDIDTAFRKFTNRSSGRFTPATLQEYLRRTKVAVSNFQEYRADPAKYRPPPSRTNDKVAKAQRAPADARTSRRRAESTATERAETATALVMTFPLRPDFNAQLILPRDLTTEESRRLGAFIATLAADYKPHS